MRRNIEIEVTVRNNSAPVARNGFAIINDVFSGQRLDRLANDIARPASQRSRAGIRHALKIRPVALLSEDPDLVNLVRGVLGPGAFPFRATLFEKSPQSNWLVVWHQDTALPLQQRQEAQGWGPWSVKEGIIYAHAPAAALSQILALRVHLDDSTSQNGPLRVLPGTHTLGVLSDDALHELATRIEPIECIVPRGGVMAMRPLLVPSSSKSRTAHPRRVLHIEYAAAAAARPLDLATV